MDSPYKPGFGARPLTDIGLADEHLRARGGRGYYRVQGRRRYLHAFAIGAGPGPVTSSSTS